MKELAIGEVGEIEGKLVRCVEKEDCRECFFRHHSCDSIKCTSYERQDGQSVMYLKADTNTNANPCTWTQDADGIWHTSCGEAQEFTTGTREENGYKFCPYCGNEIQEAKS